MVPVADRLKSKLIAINSQILLDPDLAYLSDFISYHLPPCPLCSYNTINSFSPCYSLCLVSTSS